jgi:GTPase
VGLAASIGMVVVHERLFVTRTLNPATFLGKGQVEMTREAVAEAQVNVVVVDTKLTAVQQRNLEEIWKVKVIDRTGLILDIFGARARTREGSLQVELAHLEYQRSRLVRSWTHLERQRGGFGFLGGPGETQIEADRRLIEDRIIKLKVELEDVRRTRGLHRGARKRVTHPVVALVGYTNAGKSTLFNALTGASVFAEDQLFATLDPTMRGLLLPSGRNIILSDTVGFISSLPTELVEAFRATLEEVAEADLLLHVRDVAHPDTQAQAADVRAVLNRLAKDGTLDETWPDRTLEVLNKADLLGGVDQVVQGEGIAVSALTGDGLDRLLAEIDARLSTQMELLEVRIPVTDGAKLAWVYRHGEVLHRQDDETHVQLKIRMSPEDKARFEQL